MRKTIATLALLALASFAHADVLVSDSDSIASTVGKHDRRLAIAAHEAQGVIAKNYGHVIKPGEKKHRGGHGVTLSAVIQATGSVALIDSVGLKYFINTNITFSTSSSASAAMSEASYTHAVPASTALGGTSMSSLNDAFDGYDAICVSLSNATGPCQTGSASYAIYNKNGPAAVDATVPAIPQCTNRQYVFGTQTIGGLSVRRKIYVPTNDAFERSLNFFTNTTGAPITFTMITSNNLGSDSNTRIVTTSSGDNVVTTADNWITSFQLYSGNTSSDPRLGHVVQGPGAPTPVSNVNFVDGDDNPYWGYLITLNPGQTKAIMNFVTGQPSKAAAATQAAALTALPSTATQCMSATEISQVVNFALGTDLSITMTAPAFVSLGGSLAYTLSVTNNGPATASNVSVSDPLPAGVTFVSASGTGWTCGFAAGTVTCTLPTLAVGAASPITINTTATGSPGTTRSNTATVSSATTDPTPANNSANAITLVGQALVPGPSLGRIALALMLTLLAFLGIRELSGRRR